MLRITRNEDADMPGQMFAPVFENAPDVLGRAATRLPSGLIKSDKKVAHWVGPEF